MIGIISDVHGNYAALMAVLDALDRMRVSEIICLGDTAGYYCQINECCDALRGRGIFSLQGNHDWYLSSEEGCPRSTSANRCLAYQRDVVTEENLAWLATLKPRAHLYGIDFVHGGWNDPLDEYFAPEPGYFAQIPGNYFASGHTHVQLLWSQDGKTYCNPGAVGQPRDGNPDAGFAVWDGRQFKLFRVPYDVNATQRAMRDAGFEPYYYDNLAIGARIGGKIDGYPSLAAAKHEAVTYDANGASSPADTIERDR